MREILFRGKRVDNEEWVEGSLVNNIFFRAGTNRPVPYIINPDEYEEYCCMEDIGELAVEVIDDTVGQFTGLIDKNGNKIFEGDILSNKTAKSMYSEYGEKYTVKYCDDLGKFECDYQFGIELYLKFGCEIIGNIHDNPELIQETT